MCNSCKRRLITWSARLGLLIKEGETQAIIIGYSGLLNNIDFSSVLNIRVSNRNLEFTDED